MAQCDYDHSSVETIDASLNIDSVFKSLEEETESPKPEYNEGKAFLTIATTAKAAYLAPSVSKAFFPNLVKRDKISIGIAAAVVSCYTMLIVNETIDMGYGKALFMDYTGTLGFIIPYQIATVLHYATDIDDRFPESGRPRIGRFDNSAPSGRVHTWLTLFAVPYGMYLGWLSPFIKNNDAGNALVVIYLSESLAGLGYAVPLYRYDPSLQRDKKKYYTYASALSLGLLSAGMFTGSTLVKHASWSTGRGMLLHIAGGMGTATGALLPEILNPHSPISEISAKRLRIGGAVAGITAGSWIGLRYHAPYQFTPKQAAFIASAAACATLSGIGIPYVFNAKHRNTYYRAGIAGAWAGYFAGEYIVRNFRIFSAKQHQTKTPLLCCSAPGVFYIPLLMNKQSSLYETDAFPLATVTVNF